MYSSAYGRKDCWSANIWTALTGHGCRWPYDQITAVWFKKTCRNPSDRGKHGVKRSLMTDSNGLALALIVAGANTHDIKRVADTLDTLETGRPGRRLRLGMDKGYEAGWLEAYLKGRRYEPHIQSRKEESEAIKPRILRLIAGLWRERTTG